MLENARRQTVLLLIVTAAAILSLIFGKVHLGLDLSGGTQLIYEVNVDQAKKKGLIPVTASQTEIDGIMQETVEIINDRIDPQGTTEAVVTRRGATGILVELPRMSDADAEIVEARIRDLGRLEMRIVADDSYSKGDVSFDTAEEKKRLKAWLDENDGANRKMVAEDPFAIDEYNLQPPGKGPASPFLRWYPKRIDPSPDDASRWGRNIWTWGPEGEIQATVGVPAFGAAEYNNGDVPDGAGFLVELVPINMHEVWFKGEDLDPGATRPGLDDLGAPAINYQMRPSQQGPYADWSEEYRDQRSAIILNGIVKSAPTFLGRISGRAQITGQFTDSEVAELVKVLRTGSLKVQPTRQSRDVIGPTLGQASIERGVISILAGGTLVLLFILAYYRVAGLVAFLAIALNILLILGVVMLLRATLTLPGLAGLVLTMGMAIDANILIYERIREEISRGKEMLQACRTGFDRAMVTILDANITTFLAGLVLYNVGIGPIRGFAVTLMIGIVTTLFTAFFVSRLIFHYLLERGTLRNFRFREWLHDLKFNFLRWSKLALTFSSLVIVAGLALFLFVVPTDTSLHLDFKGGANLKVALEQPTTADEIRELLAADEDFHEAFPAPIVNTFGAVNERQAREFSIKIKLSDALRAQIDAARSEDPEYKPPYLTGIERVLKDRLVEPPYSQEAVIPDEDVPSRAFAEIALHFAAPVELADVRARLDAARFTFEDDPEHKPIRPLNTAEDAEAAKDLKIYYFVGADTHEDELFEPVRLAMVGITDAEGNKVLLSDPIPESSEIGGRMVGELRNAAIGSLLVAMFLIVMFIRVRFHEYKYGIAAVTALVHDVLVTLGIVVGANALGLVDAEIGLAMIAAFLTIIGYSINDTIVIFDRVRENLNEQTRLGERVDHAELLNRSINQTLSRTILTTVTTLFVVVVQFVVNSGTGTSLEGFSFALIVGLVSGTYSTVFIASPVVLWLWRREGEAKTAPEALPAPSSA